MTAVFPSQVECFLFHTLTLDDVKKKLDSKILKLEYLKNKMSF